MLIRKILATGDKGKIVNVIEKAVELAQQAQDLAEALAAGQAPPAAAAAGAVGT